MSVIQINFYFIAYLAIKFLDKGLWTSYLYPYYFLFLSEISCSNKRSVFPYVYCKGKYKLKTRDLIISVRNKGRAPILFLEHLL